MPSDYRFNPFSNIAEPLHIIGETHVIPSSTPYFIRLNEVPVKDAPSTVSLTIAGVAATEVAAEPAAGEFRCDYTTGADSDENWNTGLIQFNAADAGKLVEVTYNGLGTLASVKAPSYPAWFTDRGDGSDGDYSPTASTTLAGGTYNFKSVNIPAGVVITLMGCVEIKCLGAFTCAGIITANGANGVSDTSNSVASCAGGGGCNGYLTNKGGDSTVAGSPGYGGGVGGASGAAPNIGAVAGGSNNGGSVLDLLSPITNKNYLIADKRIICGGGGGGAPGSPAYAMYGGGGGGGGASIYITAHNANVSGGITANGGNGGAGYNSGDVYNRSGGGGGGGGGAVVIVADTISNTGTITANGGTGGTQTNNTSYAGVAGSNGIVYLKELGAA